MEYFEGKTIFEYVKAQQQEIEQLKAEKDALFAQVLTLSRQEPKMVQSFSNGSEGER